MIYNNQNKRINNKRLNLQEPHIHLYDKKIKIYKESLVMIFRIPKAFLLKEY